MSRNYFKCFCAWICLASVCLSARGNPVLNQREGYFNGTSYVRIHSALSLLKQIGLSFRSCHGGELFTQRTNGNTVLLEVRSDGLVFAVTIDNQRHESRLRADLLDNTWHSISIMYRLGNLTLSAAGHQQVIANSTFNSEIVQTELSSENSVLIVGNAFNGCILDGPGIIFNDSRNIAHGVQWGKCPLNTNSCTKMDHCFNAPCFKGTCISRPDRYECRCTARYSGKNCDKDNGPVCDRNPCLNNGACTEDDQGNYACLCGPGHTGQHCETELSSHLCENNPCQHDGSCRVSAIAGRYECTCQPGYAGENCELNVNECQSNPCQHGGACVDGINNYTCQCGRTGYQGDHCEQNINECEHNPCLNQGRCFDTYGGYTCECLQGYGGSNCELNLDECSSTPCLNNGICEDLIGSYKCKCHLGFTGQNCEQNIDNCQGVVCPPHAECVDGINSHKCVCKQGYLGVPPDCTEATSCQSLPCYNGGTCQKHDNVYNCSCAPGFTGTHCELELRNAALIDRCPPCRNGGSCGANNECECPQGFAGPTCEVAVTCATYPCRHGQCNDYSGGYYCTCEPGWTGPGCDVDVNGCLMEPCRNAGTCTPSGNTHVCECVPGYTGKMCQINIDECESSPCMNGGICMDLVNGYSCNCTSEFMGEQCERELDVCALVPCHHNGTCVGKRGRREYHCDCAPGYEGQHCELNVNDCAGNPCPPDKVCVDSVNAYECRCANGLAGDNCTVGGEHCAGNPCHNNATCREVGGNHFCECLPGFRGESCEVDVDECMETPRLCNNGICQNSLGGYECFCRPGFSGDHCNLDFDECLSHPCMHQATCINKINSFTCICPPGYTGRECGIEINECESNPCSAGATCVDQVAAYMCECPPGLAGKRCETNIDECESSPCHNGGHCMDEINAYTCNCSNTGFDGLHCEHNIDDCLEAFCVNNGTCVDGINRYDCQCYPGYTGKNCEIDINECESSPCQNGGSCLQYSNRSLYHLPDEEHDVVPTHVPLPFQQEFSFSAASGYECVCVAGVMGNNCEININECESNPCVSGTCIDKIGSFVCECGEGFEGPLCEIDIDECLQQPCVYGTCTDKRADYACECQSGYGGKNCSVQLTGCDDGKCLNNGTCIPYLKDETEHMFNCSCSNGFHGPVCGKITTMSLNGHSYLMTNTTRDEGYDIQFRFRTTLPSGLIALGEGLTYYILELVDGRLNLHSSLLNKWDGVFIGSKLNDSEWHKVFVAINTSHVVLAANEEQTIYPINWNQDSNVTHTSFSSTYLGGSPNLGKLTHSQSYFIGCMQDVVVNNKWILPQDSTQDGVTAVGIEIGCSRSEQCDPNPCHNNGVCSDQWWNFACACERPFLGHTCQYTLTAATFGYENTTHSSVTVRVDEPARKALFNIVDISMFVRTREERGFIFYMGATDLTPDATFIAAQLEGGELLVRIQFNGTPEAYTVSGVKLSDGRNYLIQVVRNVTLIQVKINGTEYFRKTISASGPLDVQVLYLGGFPPAASRYARDTAGGFASLQKDLANVRNLKGIIQDVQVTNGKQRMVVEFFPLLVEGLSIPKRVGNVSFDPNAVLEGVVSDDACRVEPCSHNATCHVTWNDFECECPRGYKGKTCADMEFCQLQDCPYGSVCRNLDHGYECVANLTFEGVKTMLDFTLEAQPKPSLMLDTIEIQYRSQTGGTILYVSREDLGEYVSVSVFRDEVTVAWRLDNSTVGRLHRFRKDPDGNWTDILLEIKDNKIKGGFKGATDSPQYFMADSFPLSSWLDLLFNGKIILGSGADIKGLADLTSLAPPPAVEEGEGGATFNPMDGNDVDMSVTVVTTDIPVVSLSGAYFKGCLGEVRIGHLLLPYFTTEQLLQSDNNAHNTTAASIPDNNHTSTAHFLLVLPVPSHHVGCVLCFEYECQNQGSCLDPEGTYACDCQPGFAADDCSINVDECKKNECANGAACVDGTANYTCECPLGWEGWLCDRDIDECASGPCENAGTCLDLLSSFECVCPEEYMGARCEYEKPITCENSPCRLGSTCIDGKNPNKKDNFTCTCVPGYEGDYCEMAYCQVQPCRNNGGCDTTSTTPACRCPAGFTGRYCEENINECLERPTPPCLHDGKCIDGINSFTCDCRLTGYEGSTCDRDINECETRTAECGTGQCINSNGGYICMCLPGTCGQKCEYLDPCVDGTESPCQHDGSCTPRCLDFPGYTCKCQEPWTGANCTDEIQSASHNAIDVAIIVAPIVGALILIGAISISFFVSMARKKRATRGTYSPSSQEYCNPRVEMDNVMKPPPEERLI